MSEFESKDDSQEDGVEDGWSKVGKKKTQRLTEAEQEDSRLKAAKKRKKGQLVCIIYHNQETYTLCYD